MTKKYTKQVIEASKILGSAFQGDRSAQGILKEMAFGGDVSHYLTEAYATTDMLAAFNISARETLEAQYPKADRVWTQIATRKRLPDFKEQAYREFTWDKGLLVDENAGRAIVPGALAVIPEGTEYPSFGFSTSGRSVKLHKHGARFPFFWEMVVNGEWEDLGSIPGRMSEFALQTEEVEAFVQLASTTGPRADVFTGDLAPGTAKLSLESLSAAKTEVRSRKVNGRAVRVPRFALVVAPALEETAKQLLAITRLQVTDANGVYDTTTSNGDITLVVADVLVDIDTSANVDTTWYLVPLQGKDGTRESITVNFLERHENPDLRISSATGSYLGGGSVPGLEGSLLNDDAEYRVRHVVTGAIAHADGLYASIGTV